jgi:hypothetical protein
MPELSRRTFLIRGSLGAAAIAAGTAIPGLPTLLTTTEEEAPAVDDAATTAAAASTPSVTEPLIAHITDLRSGAMSLFMGEQEFAINDPGLANRLFGAAK